MYFAMGLDPKTLILVFLILYRVGEGGFFFFAWAYLRCLKAQSRMAAHSVFA